jgi:hypothetical protein
MENSMVDARPEPWRPMNTAPKDGTIVRLLVDYSGDGCHPLEDAEVAQTIGGCTDDHTGLTEGWKFAGWSWEQDCFTEGKGKPIGWLPFAHLDLTRAQASTLPNDPHVTRACEEEIAARQRNGGVKES